MVYTYIYVLWKLGIRVCAMFPTVTFKTYTKRCETILSRYCLYTNQGTK